MPAPRLHLLEEVRAHLIDQLLRLQVDFGCHRREGIQEGLELARRIDPLADVVLGNRTIQLPGRHDRADGAHQGVPAGDDLVGMQRDQEGRAGAEVVDHRDDRLRVFALERADGGVNALGFHWRSARAVDRQHDGLHVGIRESLLQQGHDRVGRSVIGRRDLAFDAHDAHHVAKGSPAESGRTQKEEEVDDAEQDGQSEHQGLEQHAPAVLRLPLSGREPLSLLERFTLPPHLAHQLQQETCLPVLSPDIGLGVWSRIVAVRLARHGRPHWTGFGLRRRAVLVVGHPGSPAAERSERGQDRQDACL